MLFLLTALLTAPIGTDTVPLASDRARTSDPAVQITLNGGDYLPGERVNVQVQTRDDGYLVAFRVDGDGRIRVLFPLDPDQDAFVRGGKKYDLRGRADRNSFLADDQSGNGLVYAAITREPMMFRGYSLNGHWDYNTLRLHDSSTDAESDLNEIVSRMTANSHFDYDAVSYRVKEIASSTNNGYYPGFYDPYYNPSWRCFSCGWGYPRGGFNLGIGLSPVYDPFYDPFYYDPFYGYNAGFGYGFGYGFGGGFHGGGFVPIFVGGGFGRPVLPNTIYGTRPRPRPNRPIPAGSIASGIGIGTGIAPRAPSGLDRGRPVTGAVDRRPSSGPVGRSPAPVSARPTAPSGPPPGPSRARPRPIDEAVVRRPPVAAPAAGVTIDRRTPDGRPVVGEFNRPGVVRPGFREPPRPQPQGDPSVQRRPDAPPTHDARPVYREPPRPTSPPESRPQPSTRSAPPPSHSSPPASRGGGGGSSRGHR